MKDTDQRTALSRNTALRQGLLLDITHIAHATFIIMPSAISPALWHALAGDQPFERLDPRIACVCWSLYLARKGRCYTREQSMKDGQILWFTAHVFDNKIHVKATAHPGDQREAVLTFSLPGEDLCFPIRGGQSVRTFSAEERRQSSVSGLVEDDAAFDISPIARLAFIEVPIEMSPALWQAVAGDAHFSLEDPRLLELCWAVTRALLTTTMIRQEFAPFAHTVWGRAVIRDRQVAYKLITHRGKTNAKEPAMTLLCDQEHLATNN